MTPPSLTPRERQILAMLAQGMTARRIAVRLQIAERTVEKHASNLYRKLGVGSRDEAVERATADGLLASRHRTTWPVSGGRGTYSR